MISLFFQLILMLVLAPILFVLQAINIIITTIQYIFVRKNYNNIQELFTENSKYLEKLFKD